MTERIKALREWYLGLSARWRWGIAIGAVLLVIVLIFLLRPRPQEAPVETVTVTTGDLTGGISASGTLSPTQDVILSMSSSGIVAEVLVKEGQSVKKGTPLIKLDDTDAARQVQKAELDLRNAELNLEIAKKDLQRSATWAPDPEKVAIAQANLDKAAAALAQAQSNYDKVAWVPSVGALPQASALQDATTNYTITGLQYNDLFTNHPDASKPQLQVQVAQINLEIAKLALETAKAALDHKTLLAPFNGIVTGINVAPGEMAGTNVLEMISNDEMDVVLDVDEIDVGGLAVGQTVTVQIEAWPDKVINGKVSFIASKSSANASTGVATYEVRIHMDKTDLPIRAGMSASAVITTFDAKGVLLVPNSAITPNRTTHTYIVIVMTANGSQDIEVTLGVRNTEFTQVLSGVKEGDVLLVTNGAPRIKLGDPNSAPRPGQGFGGFGGGG
jgi:HlyD family secretion protein